MKKVEGISIEKDYPYYSVAYKGKTIDSFELEHTNEWVVMDIEYSTKVLLTGSTDSLTYDAYQELINLYVEKPKSRLEELGFTVSNTIDNDPNKFWIQNNLNHIVVRLDKCNIESFQSIKLTLEQLKAIVEVLENAK